MSDLRLIGTVTGFGFPGDEERLAVNVFDGPDMAPVRLTIFIPEDGGYTEAWLTKEQTRELVGLLDAAILQAVES